MKRVLCWMLVALLLTLSVTLPQAAADNDASSITFTASENFPLPDVSHPIPKGHIFSIDGVVQSRRPLRVLKVELINSKGKTVQKAQQTFAEGSDVTSYRLLDPTFSKSITCFAEKIPFHKLGAGTFTLKLIATDADGNTVTLVNRKFKVTSKTWVTLLPNNLRNNYTDTLRFFGSTEKFLFRYKFRSGSRKITVDSAWRKKYATSVKGVNGKFWSCHVDAKPYFKQAVYYLENTYIRVKGDGLDTGAVRLSDLVTYNGSMVTRYVSTRDFISHHSFGTAIDINADSPSCRNVITNRATIYREVHDNLTYDGLKTIDGKQCYAFTYTGSAASGPKNVPEPLLNYFIYELGFYRAGFSWGLYYTHTCDGMHFSLSELSPSLFADSPYAMRKVRVYWEDVGTARPGWHRIDELWFYFDADGNPAIGWQEIHGKWYWFAPDGSMFTGWKQIGNPWYYFRSSGAMAIGWQKIDDVWFYFRDTGAMVTGWKKIDDRWYYFRNSGAMTTGWRKIDGSWYHFETSGAMTVAWRLLSGKWYYFGTSGKMVTGVQIINGKQYTFDENGVWIS